MRGLLVVSLIAVPLIQLFGIGPAAARRDRTENVALLGVVTKPSKEGVKVVHVLNDSPAAKAGLEIKDVLFRVGSSKIESPLDLDDALKPLKPGARVKVGYLRGGKKETTRVRLMGRADYRGDFLKRRKRGEVGFEAPDWYGFAWRNLGKGDRPPTREGSAGKVVVIHCFQSW